MWGSIQLQLRDFSFPFSSTLALHHRSRYMSLFFQLMKICDSSMFQPIHLLLLIQFLQITLLLITYMNLDTCSALFLHLLTQHWLLLLPAHTIFISFCFPHCGFFQGLLYPLPEEAITNNSIPTLNFS